MTSRIPLLAIAALASVPLDARASGEDELPTLPPFEMSNVPAPSPRALDPDKARAPEAPSARFGARGQVVISGDASAGIASTQYDGSNASLFAASLVPSFDVFFVKHVSIGLGATFAYGDAKGYGADGSLVRTRTSTFSAGPRFGVEIPLGRVLSLWPLVTLAVESVHRDETVVTGQSASVAGSPIAAPSTTLVGPSISGYLPLLLRPVPHLFIGVGPQFFHEFGNAVGGPNVGGQRTSLGGGLVVGGYFGGAPVEATRAESRPSARRFGEAGEFVITNEEVLAGDYTTYAGTGAFEGTLSAEIAVDWFAEDYVSIGAFVQASYAHTLGYEPSGATVTYERESFNTGPRVGVNIPFTRDLSLYPRVQLGFGRDAYNETDGVNQDTYTDSSFWFSGSVPLLVHAASHFFVGLGPNFAHDFSRTASFPNGASVQNRGTTIGAGLVVGGWL